MHRNTKLQSFLRFHEEKKHCKETINSTHSQGQIKGSTATTTILFYYLGNKSWFGQSGVTSSAGLLSR
jgi:hypothetical protein